MSVILGAVTHVVWDTFTHHDRWGTRHLVVLTEPIGPLPVYKWLQFASGVLGLLGLVIWAALWLRRTPPTSSPAQVRPGTRQAARFGAAAIAVLTAGLVGVMKLRHGGSLEAAAFAAVNRSMAAVAIAALLVSVLWLMTRNQRRRLGDRLSD